MGQRSFKSLTSAGQRVRIARDVLKQLAAGVVSSTGGYLRIMQPVDMGAPLKPQLLETPRKRPCSACAIGALFVSSVILQNHVSADDLGLRLCGSLNWVTADRETVAHRLHRSGIFSKRQLKLIEMAFEGGDFDEGTAIGKEKTTSALNFYHRHRGDRNNRMAAIMRNIIKNRGEFVP